jgi:hypothetical protein
MLYLVDLGVFDPEEGFNESLNNNSRALHNVQSFRLQTRW